MSARAREVDEHRGSVTRLTTQTKSTVDPYLVEKGQVDHVLVLLQAPVGVDVLHGQDLRRVVLEFNDLVVPLELLVGIPTRTQHVLFRLEFRNRHGRRPSLRLQLHRRDPDVIRIPQIHMRGHGLFVFLRHGSDVASLLFVESLRPPKESINGTNNFESTTKVKRAFLHSCRGRIAPKDFKLLVSGLSQNDLQSYTLMDSERLLPNVNELSTHKLIDDCCAMGHKQALIFQHDCFRRPKGPSAEYRRKMRPSLVY